MSDNSKPCEIRAALLELARGVLFENAHMAQQMALEQKMPALWHEITTDQIIAEAEKLYNFVSKR